MTAGNSVVRHDVYMTNTQRHHAASATTWFADATFQPAGDGFRQLFTINCFIEAKDGEVTQIPVAFAFMKRKRHEDYVAVLKAIDDLLLVRNVKFLVTDFEAAVWSAAAEVFPGIIHYGCSFHWIQCLLRMLIKLGFFTEYLLKGSEVHRSVKLMLSLCHLPPEKIPQVYQHVKSLAPRHLDKFFTYIEKNWLSGTPWEPSQWSVFDRAVRTNNDCEGLHNRWNRKLKGRKSYPWVLHVLALEARRIDISSILLNHGLLKRYQKASTKVKQDCMDQYCEEYKAGGMDTFQYLQKIASIKNPELSNYFSPEESYGAN